VSSLTDRYDREQANRTEHVERGAEHAKGLWPMHVLIVESDCDGAKSLSQKLRRLGHTSVAVATMVEATAEAARLRTPVSTPFELAIVNSNLPDGGAVTLMALLEEQGIKGAVVLADDAERDTLKAAGYSFYLPAPVKLAELRAVLAAPDGGAPRRRRH
jgi:DNA-binding response OmpR family regulator